MDSSKKFLYGGVAAVVIIVVVAVVAWPRAHEQCIPTKDQPNFVDAKNIASDDTKTLANLVGYLELADKTFFPVEADTVSVGKASQPDFYSIFLESRCVSLNITYKQDKAKKDTLSYDSIQMIVKNDGENPKASKEVYQFEKDFKFEQPVAKRYSCTEKREHKCKNTAKLVLKSFEFELEAADAKDHKFKKLPFEDSCGKWSDLAPTSPPTSSPAPVTTSTSTAG